ncbi:MAG: hypothetical protein FJZ96_07360 [Chloroflexi bacterium]|nr:hypothetical protein [Chloroflexota bacterium]
MSRLRIRLPTDLILVTVLCLTGCGPVPDGASPTATTALPVAPSPIPTPKPPATLTICTASEPETLYLYSQPSAIKTAILEAIYDGPVDLRSYGYQPVILEKLPSLEDGEAWIDAVEVQAGDWVTASDGERRQLADGLTVRPAGCRTAQCELVYSGGSLSMDRMSAIFHLLDGLTWADGAPLTSADSVFSYRVASQPATPYGTEGLASRNPDSLQNTASYEALDAATLLWQGLPGYLAEDHAALFFTPLPGHLLSGYTAVELAGSTDAGRLPLGWGAYSLVEWVSGERIILERNPLYFRAGEGLPVFDRLVFTFIEAAGMDVRTSLPTNIGCDILLPDAIPPEALDEYLALHDSGVLRLVAAPVSMPVTWEQLFLGIQPDQAYTRPDFFGDVRVRRAIAYCIDRTALARSLYGDLAQPMETYLPPGHPLLFDIQLPFYPYDPLAASDLLEEAGWQDADGDGVREAHGIAGVTENLPLRLNFVTTELRLRQEAAALIRSDLLACGMDTVFRTVAARELLAETPQAELAGRHFDLALVASRDSGADGCVAGYSLAIPSAANAWDGANLGGFASPGYDEACLAAMSALPGSTGFVQARQAALLLFAQELPALPLFMRLQVAAARPQVTGLDSDPSQASLLWNIEEFDLEP